MTRGGSEGETVAVPVLGLPVRLETPHQPLCDVFLEAYGAWSDAGVPLDSSGTGVVLRAWLRDEPRAGTRPGRAGPPPADGAPRIRAGLHRLSICGAGVRAAAFADTAAACCELAPHWLEDLPRLKSEVLDTLLLFLLTRQDRVPLHGAGLVLGGVAAVLAGRAGSGKSTLALAGIRAGLHFLSEDAVYVQTRPGGRVWGWPGAIHIAPSQLAGLSGIEAGGQRIRSGKSKAAIDPQAVGSAAAGLPTAAHYADRSALFVLERGVGRAALHPLTLESAAAELADTLEPGFHVFRSSSAAAVGIAGGEGCWRLSLGEDPAQAVALVQEVVGARL